MGLLKKILVLAIVCFFCCCGHKAGNSPEKEKPVELKDFMGIFPAIRLPATFNDSSLSLKPRDSAISANVLLQFIPDSVFHRYFAKGSKTRFYADGKAAVRNEETYLFLKSLASSKRTLYLLGFNKSGKFAAALPLLIKDEDADIKYASAMDNKYTVTVSKLHKDPDGQNIFKKSVYVFNEEGAFTLIMTESNEQKSGLAQIYNPIDTLSHKHKFTGDYMQDKRNFISVRDGRSNAMVRFFVHFEKENGACTGQLKGEARFISSDVARYSANGDPCSIELAFTEKSVRMRELEGCGNHRGIRCYFDGVYDKRKTAKSKQAKPKPKYSAIK